MAYIATGNREDALDITQDAMFKLIRKYAGRPEGEWGPLFHRIMQTTIRDWYRRHAVRQRLLQLVGKSKGENMGAISDYADTSQPSAHDQLAGERVAAVLDQALHRLPLRQQQVFMLRVWEGLNVSAAARAMGCSEGSVKTHYSRALQTLRQALGDYCT